ncbi:hypothetical protein Tco_1371542 [Tanacetum coccineum]
MFNVWCYPKVFMLFNDPHSFLGWHQFFVGNMAKMAFRNFVYAEDEEDLSFLPKEPPPGFGTGSPSVVATRMKNRKCKTRGGSSRPPVKRYSGFPRKFTLSWKNHWIIIWTLELLDLHDRYYAQKSVVDNVVNMRSHELLEVIEKLRGECDVIKERERAREEESESLRANFIPDEVESQKVGNSTKPAFRTLGQRLLHWKLSRHVWRLLKYPPKKEVDYVKGLGWEVKGYRHLYKKEQNQAGTNTPYLQGKLRRYRVHSPQDTKETCSISRISEDHIRRMEISM